MSRSVAAPFLSLVLAFSLAGCGDDNDSITTPTKPATPPPNIAGTYYGSWVLQVLRKSDGFQKQFRCYGRITFRQSGTSTSTAALTGFAGADSPCTPESWDLSEGAVRAGGALEFTTSGPAPLEGPCPGGKDVKFAGQSTPASSGSYRLSARGVTNVSCPQYGEHEFTYIIDAWRY